MDSDQALRLLGKYNRWQIENYITISLGFGLPFAWMMLSVVFIGDTPNYRCALPVNATLNDTIPYTIDDDGELIYDKCLMYRGDPTVDNTTISCTEGYWYDPASGYESTLTTEWDLVCGKDWLVELSMTISSVGAIFGALLFNRLGDIYGRKKVFLGCLWSNVIIAVGQAMSPNIIVYIVASFLDGFAQQGIVGASYVLSIELFPTEQRTFAGNAIEFFWTFGYMSLVVFAYFIRNWRYLMLAISLPLVVSVSFYWILSESVPWLAMNGRTQEAEKILRKAARKSKITLPDHIFDKPIEEEMELMEKEQTFAHEKENVKEKLEDGSDQSTLTSVDISKDEDQQGTGKKILDIFRSKTLRKYSLVQFAAWFTAAFAYSAITLTVTYLPGDRYLNTFLYAVTELPAYGLTWLLAEKVGRRLPVVAFYVLGGIALLGTLIQFLDTPFNSQPLVIVFSMLGKTMLTSAFAMIYVIAPELFPTNLRNVGLGFCMMFARIAMVISPFARTLTRHTPWLTTVVMGCLSVVVGGLCLLLPETRHTKLPDTIKEIEGWTTKTSAKDPKGPEQYKDH